MKKLCLLALLVFSFSVLANDADTCKSAYRYGYTELVEASLDFNDRRID